MPTYTKNTFNILPLKDSTLANSSTSADISTSNDLPFEHSPVLYSRGHSFTIPLQLCDY